MLFFAARLATALRGPLHEMSAESLFSFTPEQGVDDFNSEHRHGLQ